MRAQTLVTPETAARFHLERDRRNTIAIGTTAVSFVHNVLLRNLEFAGKRYGTKSVASISLAVLPTPGPAAAAKAKALPSPLAGVIGADVLSEYDIDFNFAGKSMTLYKVRGCSKVTPPWTDPYTPLAIKITPHNGIAMPVEIDGYKHTALLDTGSTGFAMTRRGALKTAVTDAMLKTDPASEVVGAGGVVSKQPQHRFKTFVVGGETLRDLTVGLFSIERACPDVLVGQTYLLFRRVWISYSTRMLYIAAPKAPLPLQSPAEPVTAFLPAPPTAFRATPPAGSRRSPRSGCISSNLARDCAEGFIGMKVIAMSQPAIQALGLSLDAVLMICEPDPSAPAGKAGLRAGDLILASDGLPIFGPTAFENSINFKGEGHQLTLSILRQRERLTIVVPLAGLEEGKRLQKSQDRSARLERIIAEESAIFGTVSCAGVRIRLGLFPNSSCGRASRAGARGPFSRSRPGHRGLSRCAAKHYRGD